MTLASRLPFCRRRAVPAARSTPRHWKRCWVGAWTASLRLPRCLRRCLGRAERLNRQRPRRCGRSGRHFAGATAWLAKRPWGGATGRMGSELLCRRHRLPLPPRRPAAGLDQRPVVRQGVGRRLPTWRLVRRRSVSTWRCWRACTAARARTRLSRSVGGCGRSWLPAKNSSVTRRRCGSRARLAVTLRRGHYLRFRCHPTGHW